VWSPLAQGFLTGKYIPGAPLPASCRAADLSQKGFINTDWFKPKMLQAIQDLKPLAAEAGLTLAQFALAWVLRQSNVAAAIIGASRPEQIDENVAASGHALSPELAHRAEAIIAAAS
jgi:1-deoxyxylulose-5-phosphate synthase